MKKGLFFVLAALFSNQLIADEISGGPRINMQSGQLTIPCVEVDDPESAFDQRFFDVRLKQSGDSFELFYVQEEDSEACKPLIKASLNADKDTSDVNGDLGGTAAPAVLYKVRGRGPAGGKVFYVTDAGLHGLEAAPEDQGETEWGCYGILALFGDEIGIDVGAKGFGVGTGANNTSKILAKCDELGAARLAASYVLNGYNDWFLPSKDELNLINFYKDSISVFANDNYWSSSEGRSGYAWCQAFYDDWAVNSNFDSLSEYNGEQLACVKFGIHRVRAVRAF